MRRIILALAGVLTVGGLALFTAPARAHDYGGHHRGNYHHGWGYLPYAYPAYRAYPGTVVAPAAVYAAPAVVAPAPVVPFAGGPYYPAAPAFGLGIQTPRFSLFLGR